MATTVGSLCTGYGGLDLAAEAFFEATTSWVSEVDEAPATVLAARFPGVPNLGDLTAIRWADVPPVDVLTAGYPCQPFSQAGLRRGHHDERHLWPHIRDGIEALRPKAVLLENVRGHLRLGAGQVISDLAHLGYVGRWEVVRADETGAPHRRERLFILGWRYRGCLAPADPGRLGAQLHGGRGVMVDAEAGSRHQDGGDDHEGRPPLGDRSPSDWAPPTGRGDRGRLPAPVGRGWLLPTPAARDGKGGRYGGSRAAREATGRMRPDQLEAAVRLLPTPVAHDTGRSPEAHMAMREGMGRKGPTSLGVVLKLLPTPTSTDHTGSRRATARTPEWVSNTGVTLTDAAWMVEGLALSEWAERWGPYAAAVERWEALTRPAPEPLDGKAVAAPFVEWMMGLPEGWVSELLPNRKALKVLGNGVMPAQAVLALGQLTHDLL